MTIGRRPATKSEAAKAIRLCDVISQVHKALAYPTCELVTIENPAEKFCDLFLGGSGATKKAPAFCSYRRKKNLQEWLVLKVLRLQLEAAEEAQFRGREPGQNESSSDVATHSRPQAQNYLPQQRESGQPSAQQNFSWELRERMRLIRAERDEAVRRELSVGSGPEVRRQ